VTGADGFIGSHLTEFLVRSGHSVRAFVFYNSFGSWGWLDEAADDVKAAIDVFAGDVRDPYGVKAAMTGCDVVMHLAALIGIPYSYHSPDTYIDTNIKGTLNVLQAARELGVAKVVVTSTSEVYGTAKFVPITETHPLQGQSPYSASKIGADQLAFAFHASFGMPVAIIRPFNTYGPRQSTRAILPTAITQLAAGRKVLKLGALHPTRDFNYVSDIVRAFVAVAGSDRVNGEVVNIGSNFEIAIGDAVRIVAELMGVPADIETETQRMRPLTSEVERLWADNAKARDLTGWAPQFAGLDGFRRGLGETIAWYREPKNLRRFRPDHYSI